MEEFSIFPIDTQFPDLLMATSILSSVEEEKEAFHRTPEGSSKQFLEVGSTTTIVSPIRVQTVLRETTFLSLQRPETFKTMD